MEKITLLVDDQSYSAKPQDAGRITNRIIQKQKTVTPKELADLVSKGHTMVLATMNGKRAAANMEQQQVLALDFDNKDEEGNKTEGLFYQSLQQTLADPFIKENASFIYKTFSYQKDWEKFRVVFILDKPLTNLSDVKAAYAHLSRLYPNGDLAPTSPASIFYGGTEAVEINFSNALAVNSLPKGVEAPKKEKVLSVAQARETKAAANDTDTPVWKLLELGQFEEVKKIWEPFTTRLHSKRQAMNYIKTIPMIELLGLPTGTFRDIFHDEENPSAGVFQTTDSKVWMYKCHSSSNPFDGDIFKVVGQLTGNGYVGAVNLLIDLIPIKIEVTDQIKELRESWGVIQEILLSEELKRNFPDVHSRFWRYKTDINALIDILKENIYEDENGELRALTYLSTRRLASKLYGSERKYQTISRVLNLMDYTNWIDKLDETQIPNDLLKKLKTIQAREKYSKRTNVYELTRHEDENRFFEELNKTCGVMKEKGMTVKTLNREGILATDGKEKADEVFVQDKERGISKNTEEFYKDMYKLVTFHLQNELYIEQNQILDELAVKWKKSFTENTYKKMLPRLLREKKLKKNRLTKSLKENWGIEHSQSFPTVLYAA